MAMNLDALKNLDESRKRGMGSFMKSNEIKNTLVRLVPPPPELNGMFYFEQKIFWVDKTPLISDSTFGKACKIQEYLTNISDEMMRAKLDGESDEDFKVMYNRIEQNKSNFLIPLINLINIKYDSAGEKVVSYEVSGGVKILQTGVQMRDAITKVCLSPKVLRTLEGVDDLIADKNRGYNIMLTKVGEGFSTEYGATVDVRCAIDAKHFDNVPSCVRLTKQQIYTDSYITAFLDNYFYGEEKPPEDKKISKYADELLSTCIEAKQAEIKPKQIVSTVKEEVPQQVSNTTIKKVVRRRGIPAKIKRAVVASNNTTTPTTTTIVDEIKTSHQGESFVGGLEDI